MLRVVWESTGQNSLEKTQISKKKKKKQVNHKAAWSDIM